MYLNSVNSLPSGSLHTLVLFPSMQKTFKFKTRGNQLTLNRGAVCLPFSSVFLVHSYALTNKSIFEIYLFKVIVNFLPLLWWRHLMLLTIKSNYNLFSESIKSSSLWKMKSEFFNSGEMLKICPKASTTILKLHFQKTHNCSTDILVKE